MLNSKTLVQAILAAFCAISCAALSPLSSVGGGGMMVGASGELIGKGGETLCEFSVE